METGEQVEMDLEDFVDKFKELQPIGGKCECLEELIFVEKCLKMQLVKK